MLLHIEVSADTVCGVVLCDITEVFTHPFTKCAFGVSNVLFETHLACYAINDIVGFATATPDGVVVATCNWTLNGSTSVQFYAVPAVGPGAGLFFIRSLKVWHWLYIKWISNQCSNK